VNYVIAGYSIVLSLLFLYAVQLGFRRHRLGRAVRRVQAARGATEPTDDR
jgi:branched-subunit amino acid ABC-type transport system permease component